MDLESLLEDIIGRARRDSVRKQVRSKRTEQQILVAAVRVFSRDGISRARVADIAAEAGISAPTLYEYYKGKEDLAYAVPMSFFEMFYEDFRRAVISKSSARERLLLYLSLSADFARQHAEWGRLLYLEIWPSVMVRETALRRSVDDFARIVIFLLRQGEAEGDWPAQPDIYQSAAILIGGVNQLIITWLLYRRPRNLTKASAEITARILNFLANEQDAEATTSETNPPTKAGLRRPRAV